MKKILFVVTLLCTMVFSEKYDLADPLLVEQFGANIVKEKLDTYDKDSLGLWYLKKKYNEKLRKVQQDEFEFDDAKSWAFEQLKKKLAKIKSVDKSADYHLNLKIQFGKYDFNSEFFPIEALMEDAYMQYAGKGEFVAGYRNSKLLFEKFNDGINILPMKKEEAKAFIKKRKNSNGYINRELTAHYVYTISDVKEDIEFTSSGSPMTIKFIGKLKSVEFMDKKGKKVLRSINIAEMVEESINSVKNIKNDDIDTKHINDNNASKENILSLMYKADNFDIGGVLMPGDPGFDKLGEKVKSKNEKSTEVVLKNLNEEMKNNPNSGKAEAYRRLDKETLGLELLKAQMQ